MKRKAFRAAFPYTIPIFAGFWFLVSYDHESDHLWRESGIRCREYAAGSLRAGTGIHHDADDPGASFVLRDFHAGQVQRSGMEEGVFDLRYV